MKSTLIVLTVLTLSLGLPVVATAEEEVAEPTLTVEDIARMVELPAPPAGVGPYGDATPQQVLGSCDQQCQYISYSCSQYACSLPPLGTRGQIASVICNSCPGPPGQCDLTNCSSQVIGYECRAC
jgi:hypothetical protein